MSDMVGTNGLIAVSFFESGTVELRKLGNGFLVIARFGAGTVSRKAWTIKAAADEFRRITSELG